MPFLHMEHGDYLKSKFVTHEKNILQYLHNLLRVKLLGEYIYLKERKCRVLISHML